MLNKYYLILFFSITILTTNSIPQQAGINFSLAFPQGEFGEEVDNIGYGLSGELLFLSPKLKSPLYMEEKQAENPGVIQFPG